MACGREGAFNHVVFPNRFEMNAGEIQDVTETKNICSLGSLLPEEQIKHGEKNINEQPQSAKLGQANSRSDSAVKIERFSGEHTTLVTSLVYRN